MKVFISKGLRTQKSDLRTIYEFCAEYTKRDNRAVRLVDRVVLINVDAFEAYLEQFKVK